MALIAIVEENLQTLAFVCGVLVSEGYNVVTFEHPDEFLQAGKRVQVDLIITDLLFTGVDGSAFAARVRESERFPTPILAICEMPFLHHTSVRASFVEDTLVWPVKRLELVNSVARLLEGRRKDAI